MIVSLPEDLTAFIESKIADGACDSSSDVVRDAPCLMEQVDMPSGERLVASKAPPSGFSMDFTSDASVRGTCSA